MTDPTRWFTDARFGMFLSFGLYSIPAGVWKGVRMGRNDYSEWIEVQGNWPHGLPAAEYQALTAQFNPERFDADQWMDELVGAGMKYLVVLSKHHDGFALWPSKVSRFNIRDATPFRRDIIGELKKACEQRGIRFGIYYSHWLDWEHPYGGRPHEKEGFSGPWSVQPSDEQFESYWREKCLPQVAEICDDYHPDFFWFDTWCENSSPWITERRMDELIRLVKSRDATCLINSRIGIWAHSRGEDAVDFLSMGDNTYPSEIIRKPWETSGTMNESWAYHQLDFKWKSTTELLSNLIHTTSLGGNYQLNVGPMGDGSFPPPATRRLREVGGWMVANGEAIYQATYADLPKQTWGKITKRTFDDGHSCLYLHVIKNPGSGEIIVQGLTKLPKKIRVLETNETLTVRQVSADADLRAVLPDYARTNPMPLVLVLEY